MDVKLFWSRFPGRFVNKRTGDEITLGDYKFTGSPREWYETLVETIIDCVNQIYTNAGVDLPWNEKKASIYASSDVCCILQTSVLFKPSPDVPGLGSLGGTLCNRYLVIEDVDAGEEGRDVLSIFVKLDDGSTKQGNVLILDMPENGRKA